ncbi:MAG: glycosyltransferase family 4 protein [Phycisphaerales bacterium]|nr:glycosyltransferase family 4 protein [Phycisphaerales bacterium]
MNILFISRATLYEVKGGDTIQIIKTAEELKKLGVNVDIVLTNTRNINYSQYDLVHFFNLIRPSDIIYHIDQCKLPFVVSSIYLLYDDFENNDSVKSLKNLILKPLNAAQREYVKVIARSIINKERIVSLKYIFWGHKKSIQYILNKTSLLLPNSENEYRRLKKDFHQALAYRVIPNAADPTFFNCTQEDIGKKQENMVMCVGRIEGRKNQLNIIRALKNTNYQLYLVGKAAPNHQQYLADCKREAGDNVHFLDFIDKQTLKDLYLKSKVHILPSWFETTGLSTLEALFCGCNVVITKYGDTLDYFKSKNTFICEPDNPASILESIKLASAFENKIEYFAEELKAFCWSNTGLQTYKAYQNVLQIEKIKPIKN